MVFQNQAIIQVYPLLHQSNDSRFEVGRVGLCFLVSTVRCHPAQIGTTHKYFWGSLCTIQQQRKIFCDLFHIIHPGSDIL